MVVRSRMSLMMASSVRDEAGAAPDDLTEVWHLVKPRSGFGGWLIADIKQAAPTPIAVGGQKGDLYDFPNPSGAGPVQHVQVAMIPVGNLYFFIRFQGSSAAISQQQPAFQEFLKSVKFGGNK